MMVKNVARFTLLVCIAAALSFPLTGCEEKKQQFGDKKEDWSKTTPPPQYRGPGQPGGPPMSAITGPGGPPPAAANPGAGNAAPR